MSKLLPLMRRNKILTKDLQLVRFEPNPPQMEFIEEVERQLAGTGRIRIIVLKARQMGFSTVIECLLFNMAFIFPGYRGLVLAHEIPASQNLLKMTHRYWNNSPYSQMYTQKSLSKNDISWVETQSGIAVATAGNKEAGRSATVNGVHASEAAFYPDPESTMKGLLQAVPDTFGSMLVVESTANGVGNYFNEQWDQATAGESEFKPLFYPWFRYPDYRASAIGVSGKLGKLSDEEKVLRKIGVDDDQLLWYRWCLKNKCNNDRLARMQEYPSSAIEAFVASGANVFPLDKLTLCYKAEPGIKGVLIRDGDTVEFKPAEDGPLTIYRKPTADTDWGIYQIGGDATGTTHGDYAVAQVLNRRTFEQVAVWRGRVDPGTFGQELFKLGLYYNTAEIAPEIEGPGYMTVGQLLGMNYPNVYRATRPDRTPGKVSTDQHGWSTTMQSKQLMVGWLLKTIVDESLILHDALTFSEMKNYVTLDGGGYGNGNKQAHDDTVAGLGIAMATHMMSPPLMAYAGPSTKKLYKPNLSGTIRDFQAFDTDPHPEEY